MSNTTEIYNKLVSDNRLDSGWAKFLGEKAKKADFNFEKAKGWLAVGIVWKTLGGYTADNLNFPATFDGLSRFGESVYQGGHGREVARVDGGAITEHSGLGFQINQLDDPEKAFNTIKAFDTHDRLISLEDEARYVNMTAAKPNEGAEASSQKRQSSTQRYGIGIVKTSNTLNKELKTLAAGLSARGYNDLSSEILKLSTQEVTHGRNAAAQVSIQLVQLNSLDEGWATFLEGKAADGKLNWNRILQWIALANVWQALGGYTSSIGVRYEGTLTGLKQFGAAVYDGGHGREVEQVHSGRITEHSGLGFHMLQLDDPEKAFNTIKAFDTDDRLISLEDEVQYVRTGSITEGDLRVDVQGRPQRRPMEQQGREEQEPVVREEGGQGETGEGRGSSGTGRQEGRVSWAAVQRKLTEMGGKRDDDRPLRIDGIWGPQTGHAWAQVTGGAEKPSNPDSAMEALEAIEERREQERAVREESVNRRLLAAYVMYDEEILNLSNRNGLFDQANIQSPDNFEDAQDLIDDITEARATELYNLDKTAYAEEGNDKGIFDIILERFLRRKLNEDQGGEGDTPEDSEINLQNYFNPSGTNIFMNKSTGELIFAFDDQGRRTPFPIERRTQTFGGGPDYLTRREQRKMLREVRRVHPRGSQYYEAFKDIIQGQRKYETGERNIFQPKGRARRGDEQRQEGVDTLERMRDGKPNLTRRQQRQQRRERRQRRRDN